MLVCILHCATEAAFSPDFKISSKFLVIHVTVDQCNHQPRFDETSSCSSTCDSKTCLSVLHFCCTLSWGIRALMEHMTDKCTSHIVLSKMVWGKHFQDLVFLQSFNFISSSNETLVVSETLPCPLMGSPCIYTFPQNFLKKEVFFRESSYTMFLSNVILQPSDAYLPNQI